MEPLTVVAIVTNAITLLVFAKDVVITSHEIAKSVTGQTASHESIDKRLQILRRLTTNVQQSLVQAAGGSLSKPDQELYDLGTRAANLSNQLSKILAKSSRGSKHNLWTTVKSTSRALWYRQKVDEIDQQLDRELALFNTAIIQTVKSDIKVFCESNKLAFANLDGSSKSILTSINEGNAISEKQTEILQQLRDENNSQHESTRRQIKDLHNTELAVIKDGFQNLQLHLHEANQSTPRWSSLIHTEKCRLLLKSLSRGYFARFENVSVATNRTFEWLFDNSAIAFEEWLSSDESLFWIRGKPASGKSTLMKFICTDARTDRAMNSRTGRQVLNATFFFHARGSPEERTIAGLVQAILLDLFSKAPNLLSSVVERLPESTAEILVSNDSPDRILSGLKYCWSLILQGGPTNLDIFLFLDALDEYSGKAEDLATFLQLVLQAPQESTTRVKICFSSRPLQEFLDRFQEVRGFSLQEYTKKDIEIFIDTKMQENFRMKQCLETGTEEEVEASTVLAHEIAETSDGVFLWVELVLRDLLDDYTAGASLSNLHDELSNIPPKLVDYFAFILQKIPSRFLRQTRIMLEIVRCAVEPLEVEEFIDAHRFADRASLMECIPYTLDHKAAHVDIERLLNAQCAGLIEISKVKNSNSSGLSNIGSQSEVTHVQFLHQTVKTFIESERARDLLSPPDANVYNGSTLILKQLLARVMHLASEQLIRRASLESHDSSVLSDNDRWRLSACLITYSGLAERETAQSHISWYQEIGHSKVADIYENTMWVREMHFPPIENWLDFAVVANLKLLLGDFLAIPCILRGISTPLIHLALRKGHLEFYGRLAPRSERSDIVSMLLAAGFDVNMKPDDYDRDWTRNWHGLTAFEFLWRQHLSEKRRSDDVLPSRGPLTKLLLLHGQDPNTVIKYSIRYSKRDARSLTCIALHLAARYTDLSSVKILLEAGASINSLDSQLRTPLDIASSHLKDRVQDYLDYPYGLPQGKYRVMPPNLPERIAIINFLLANGGARNPEANLEDAIYARYSASDDSLITKDQMRSMSKLGVEMDERMLNFPNLQRPQGTSMWTMMTANLLSVFR